MTATQPTNPVQAFNEILSDTFGKDCTGSIARCPAWGHDDFCFIVRGDKSAIAAKLLAAKFKTKAEKKTSEFMGSINTSWVIEFTL